MKNLNYYLLKKINKKRADMVGFFLEKGYNPRIIDSKSAHLSHDKFAEFFKIRTKDYNYLADRFQELQDAKYFFNSEEPLTNDIMKMILQNNDFGNGK